MLKIFHIIKKNDWYKSKKEGVYAPSSLQSVGFIHCAKADQILYVANSFYQGQNDLLLLKINSKKLTAELKIESPVETQMSKISFPHIYGELDISAVEEVFTFRPQNSGKFILPEDLF